MTYTHIETTALAIDRDQARQHLDLLGYKSADKLHLTAFLPKGDPRTKGENRDKGRKSDRLNYTEIEKWQAQGRGVYFVVNGHGHSKDEIKNCRAVFYEHDNLDKEIQLTLWQTLGLPSPTVQVDTGGKSIHSYWVLEEAIHPELWAFDEGKGNWKGLQADLLKFANADQSLINPNRVMRLAGCWYMAHDDSGTRPVAQSRIVGGCGKHYSYTELRGIIPRNEPPLETKRSRPNVSQDTGEGLLDFRSIGHLLPEWNERGRKGWATFQCPVHTTSGKHSNDHIHVNLSNGAWEAHCGCDRKLIYQSVCDMVGHKSSGRSFGSGNGGGIGSGGGRRGSGGSGGSGGDGGDGDGGDGDGGDRGKVVRFPRFEPLSIEQVTEKIDELITKGASGSYLTAQLNRIAAANQFFIGELRKLYCERLGEADLEIERKSNQTEVENLLQLGDQSLDLHDYLPADLATPLTAWCEWLSIRPEVVLLALLAGASSLHKVGTELVIHRNQNFRVPPSIFASLISESGQRKSPIFSNIIRQPLGVLRQEKIDAYSAAMQDYEAAMEAWEDEEDKGSKPEKPKEPTLYYFTNSTGEAIPVQASKAPEKPLLALIDELSGLLKSENSYRSGRGSDKQDLLSYFDGSGQTVLRAGGVKVDVERIYLSMFGTIQPAVLKNHMADCSDPDGQWARFLFVNQPLAAATLSDDDGQAVQIRDRIADFYRKIDQLPEMEYQLSRDAFKRYQPLYNQLERLRVTHPQPGMRAVYSKMEGYIGRLAINLHVLWELASGKACPDVEIPLFILEMAIQLAKFFVGQVKLVHAFSDDEALAPHILKLIELSKRLDANGCDGWIKAKQYQETFPKKKRPSAQQARDWMNESVALGYGCTRGEGNRLEYHCKSDNKPYDDNPPSKKDLGNLGKVGEHLGNTLPQVESLIKQGIEDNLGNLGNTPPQQSPTYEPMDSNKEVESDFVLEGGQVPQPSPTLTQDRCDVEIERGSDLGNIFPNPSPTLPQVPQVRKVQEEAIAPSQTATLATDADADKVVLPSPVATPVENEQTASKVDVEADAASSHQALPEEVIRSEVTPVRVGARVMYNYKHSNRCGMAGIVKKIENGMVTILLDYHKSLTKDLRELESTLGDLELIETNRVRRSPNLPEASGDDAIQEDRWVDWF